MNDSNGSVYKEGRYHNQKPTRRLHGDLTKLDIAKRYLFNNNPGAEPTQTIPLVSISTSDLEYARNNNEVHLYRLGHSGILLKFGADYWLIDPVFSERASPFLWLGPKRFHASPIALHELPLLQGIIISHNHYDHLDKPTIKALKQQAQRFVVPLGVGKTLMAWGVDAQRITELDWWQNTEFAGLSITATPAQHFSGRGFNDEDASLWCSFVLQHQQTTLFFSGDSGYFDGFKQIGDRFGPFDLTIMEGGGYDPAWPEVHMKPDETVQGHLDLKGDVLMAIHNGTFNLAFHDWQDPFDKIAQYSQEQSVTVIFPRFGEKVTVGEFTTTNHWWKHLE